MNDLHARQFRSMVLALVTCSLVALPVYAQNEAAAVFKAKCAACHGADGKGDTPVGKKLGVRDFASAEVQKETDEELFSATQKGRIKMPAFGSALNDTQIKDLVVYIRELSKKK